jgi:hypothetical protein
LGHSLNNIDSAVVTGSPGQAGDDSVEIVDLNIVDVIFAGGVDRSELL